MAEKKATKAATTKASAATKETVKKTTTRKCSAKKTTVALTAENVGFRAGDVYQALAAAGTSLSVSEVAKAAKITTEEVYLGIGWLLKEGKVKDDNDNITLA